MRSGGAGQQRSVRGDVCTSPHVGMHGGLDQDVEVAVPAIMM